MIRFLIFIIFCCIIAALCSCTKVQAIERPVQQKMVRVSKWFELNWKFRDSSYQEVYWNLELLKYRDTTIFPITCPLSGIEIRYYKIQ